MDYKQLRRVLRERLDASGTKADETHMQAAEEAPAAVQELPVHDLPVNIAAMIGDEMVDPPVNDAEFLPGNLQQLQHAANVLVQNVPPLQVQDFYHKLRRLVTTSIRQQDRSGEDQTDMMPEPSPDQELERADQEEANAEDKVDVTVAERIRHITQTQVTEHRVRRAVKNMLIEQSSQQEALDGFNREGLDYRDPWNDFRMMNPWIIRRLSEKPMEEIQAMHAEFELADDSRADDIVRDVQRAYLPGAIGALRKLGPPFWTEDHEAQYKGGSPDRAATGKTGEEEELLKIIANKLNVSVAAVRNILGRFNEDVGVTYAGDDKQRQAALQIATDGMAATLDTFGYLALMKYYDPSEIKNDLGVSIIGRSLLKELHDEIIQAVRSGSKELAISGGDALKPDVSVSTLSDAKNAFISKYLRDEFDAAKMTYAYRDARGEETFTSRAGKEGSRPSRDPETARLAIVETTASLMADYQKTLAVAESWVKTGNVTDTDVNRWLSFLPDLAS
jgi:hypothetical protein